LFLEFSHGINSRSRALHAYVSRACVDGSPLCCAALYISTLVYFYNLISWIQWISSYDWSPVLHVHDCDLKFQKFHDIANMVDKFLPITRTKVRQSDKPWMTPSLKISISNRQKALYKHGKSSTMFKYWCNKVIMDVKSARAKYCATSVCKLKQGNSSKWWKEVKSIGGLSSRDSWHHQLLSPDNPTCQHLVESINTFFTSLTSHFSPLQSDSTVTQSDVPASFLVDTYRSG
jgi:hypothetical protein